MHKTENKRIRLNDFKNQFELELLEKIGNRKLIAYGASGRWQDINNIIYIEDLVEFFVDSNPERWGEIYCGKEIKSPVKLKNLDTTKYAVVVSTAYFEDVKKLLDRYGLKQEIDYFNIFQYVYFQQDFICSSYNTLIRFLDSVPDKMRHIVASKTDERIGVVMNPECLNTGVTDLPFEVALFLILKWRGYDVKLIVDTLHWDGDIMRYEGHCRVCDTVTNMIVDKLKEVIPQSDIMYINPIGEYIISEQDAKECDKIAEYSVNWCKWNQVGYGPYYSWEFLYHRFSEIFKKNFTYIDAFFEENHFDVVNVSTALHKRAGVFCYAAKKKKIRVSSQDGYDKETMMISADGPASTGGDISRVIEEGWIKADEEDEILQRAVRMWDKRSKQTISVNKEELNEDYLRDFVEKEGVAYIGYQAPRLETVQAYDVVIPLNIKDDGPALVARSIFGSVEQWLTQTLDFVINKLGKSVLLREHPFVKYLPDYFSCTEIYAIYPKILEPYKDNKLLFYADSDETINLYQYMERCKVVIPWASTSGVEAGVLGKNVLIHTDVCYKDSKFVKCVHSVDEYFNCLEKVLLSDESPTKGKEAYEEALKYLYYSMSQQMRTRFTGMYSNVFPWRFECFEELLQEEGVEEVIQIVAENVPAPYLIEKQHRRLYEITE